MWHLKVICKKKKIISVSVQCVILTTSKTLSLTFSPMCGNKLRRRYEIMLIKKAPATFYTYYTFLFLVFNEIFLHNNKGFRLWMTLTVLKYVTPSFLRICIYFLHSSSKHIHWNDFSKMIAVISLTRGTGRPMSSSRRRRRRRNIRRNLGGMLFTHQRWCRCSLVVKNS